MSCRKIGGMSTLPLTAAPVGALSHIKVIDLTRILAGPYCTQLLSDYGAQVIKIEQPNSGDGSRQWGPPWIGDQSSYFLSVNRNKQSLTLNLKSVEGRTILKQLLAEADVLIENFLPGTLASMGLDYETLRHDFPQLVFCSITGYGQTGPYRDRAGYDLAIQAEGGMMSITGLAGEMPMRTGVAICDLMTGMHASSAILAALNYRSVSGKGQYIDIALLDSQVSWLINVAHGYFATGNPPARYGNAHPSLVPYQAFASADGYFVLAVGSDEQFRKMCVIMQRDDLMHDPRYAHNKDRVANRVELIEQMQQTFLNRRTDDWLHDFERAHVPSSRINDIPAVFTDPHVLARNMVQSVDHVTLGPINVVGPVAKMSATQPTVRTAPPTLGQHSADILQQLGYTHEQVSQLRATGII